MDTDVASAALIVLSAEIHRLHGGTDPIYGADYQNSTFHIHTESYHEFLEIEPGEAEPPYFEHYASGVRCWWYKHLNRSFRIECPEGVSLARVLVDCLDSLP